MGKEITFKDSLFIFLSIIFSLVIGVVFLKLELHIVLLISLFITIFYSLSKGYKWEYISEGMSQSIQKSYESMIIFLLIGATIGVWILSGTIPTLIYYGLEILSPSIFLPSGLIICSLTSLATGTSWGTVSTIGLALIGIGESLGINSALTAGMIVSGAFFGDKISPMSDTTNLSAAATKTNVYEHIKAMMYTTIPAFLIALLLYAVIGLKFNAQSIDYTQINLIKETLSSNFNISLITLIPIVIVIGFSLSKKPAVLTMISGIIVGIVVSILVQNTSLQEALNVVNVGYTTQTNVEIVDKLIVRGGIQSMMWTFSLVFIALSLGGVLERLGYLSILMKSMLVKVKSTTSLIITTLLSCILSNAVLGEAYLSIILNASLYSDIYEKYNLRSSMLSRTLEEGATLTTGIIPWTTAGIFISTTLGVSAFAYMPFTFFNLINIVLSIGFTSFNVAVLRKSDDLCGLQESC